MANIESAEDYLAAAINTVSKPARKPLPGSRAYARKELNYIAQLYLSNPHVERVELFGSFGRGEGNSYSDYDLIVVVDEYYAEVWLDAVCDRGADFGTDNELYYSRREQRWLATVSLLDVVAGSHWHKLDVFVFPPNWRDDEELTRLQEEGRHHDPDFMRNIAHDAILFDEVTGSFPWPN